AKPRRGLRSLAMVGVVVGIALGLVFALQRPSPAGVDASTYIVLPFVQRSGGGGALTPDQAELLLHNALSRWTDLRLVDAQRARDLLSRSGPPENLAEARRIAEAAGAGHLVWGEITPLGDSVVVRAALYDLTRRGGGSPQHTVRLGRDLQGVSARIGDLTTLLLGREASESMGPEGAAGTTVAAAWRAYLEGWSAMSQWELERARAALARAVDADPGYAAAHLWLAQATSWSESWDVRGWREPAARALADSASLSPRERQLARALVALGDRRFPDACRTYEAMIQRDSTDFAAWFGLGECHRRDQVVVADPASPSGHRFRSSYHRAVQAYSRALRSVPSSHRAFRGVGFGRLHELLQAGDYVLRPGWTAGGAFFASYPGLAGDTLSFVPWPGADISAGKKETLPRTRDAALLRNRRLLRDVLVEWTRAFPQSPDAHEALSVGLEDLGEIRRVKQGEPSAFSELAAARTLATARDQRLRLSLAQVRLYLRVGDFARARALADSVLAGWPHPGPRDAQALAPLAVLTGKVETARGLLHAAVPEHRFSTPQGQELAASVPVALAEGAMDALLYAAVGLSAQAAQAEARADGMIRTLVPEGERRGVRRSLLNAPRRLSFGSGGAAWARARTAPLDSVDYLIAAQQALAAGDAAAARGALQGIAATRGERRPGDVSLDFVLAESELHLALGDTAAAVDELDRALVGMEALPRASVERVDMTGSLLGAMRLRARIAAARGDRPIAEHWRGVLRTLWAGGDPRLLATIR
ncbi:MAG TPA: hypothetical protein VHG91_04670, partial [Longimicrobium sp.]|nr:hypothetical protein [Longimicrobium sp.]